MFKTGKDPLVVIEELGMKKLNDPKKINNIIDEIISKNPNCVQEFSKGNKKIVDFLVGKVMVSTNKSVNAKDAKIMIQQKLKEKLDEK